MLVFFGCNQTSLRVEAQGGRVRSVHSDVGEGYGKMSEFQLMILIWLIKVKIKSKREVEMGGRNKV